MRHRSLLWILLPALWCLTQQTVGNWNQWGEGTLLSRADASQHGAGVCSPSPACSSATSHSCFCFIIVAKISFLRTTGINYLWYQVLPLLFYIPSYHLNGKKYWPQSSRGIFSPWGPVQRAHSMGTAVSSCRPASVPRSPVSGRAQSPTFCCCSSLPFNFTHFKWPTLTYLISILAPTHLYTKYILGNLKMSPKILSIPKDTFYTWLLEADGSRALHSSRLSHGDPTVAGKPLYLFGNRLSGPQTLEERLSMTHEVPSSASSPSQARCYGKHLWSLHLGIQARKIGSSRSFNYM